MQDRSHEACRRAARHGAVTSAGRRGKLGFTLIEMVIVTTIIALMAALILPNLVVMARSWAVRNAEAAILRLPTLARNAAIRSGDPVVLRVDGDALVLERVSWSETLPAPASAAAASASDAPAPDPLAAQDAQSPQDPEDPDQVQPVLRLTLDPDMRVDTVQRNGQADDTSTWRWIVYPDGSSDAAAITFQVGSDHKTLWIPAANPDGGAAGSGAGSAESAGSGADAAPAPSGPRWISGDAPDTSNDSWAAGALEQRGTQTGGAGGAGGGAGGGQGAQGG